jgi:hypothetical protein
MKSAVIALVGMFLAFTVGCSQGSSSGGGGGGLGGGNGGRNPAQGQGTGVIGQWQGVNNGDGFVLTITTNSFDLAYDCQGQRLQGVVAITITATDLVFQENKVIGTGQCANDFQVGGKLAYTVNGNSLELKTGNGGVIQATRAPQDPANPQNPQDPQNPQLQIKLYSELGCAGQEMVYTAGMNCAQLNGQVHSLNAGQGCQNTDRAMAAQDVCQSLNEQVGGGN